MHYPELFKAKMPCKFLKNSIATMLPSSGTALVQLVPGVGMWIWVGPPRSTVWVPLEAFEEFHGNQTTTFSVDFERCV